MLGEYSDGTIAKSGVYASLLEEHLSANRPYPCAKKWQRLLGMDDDQFLKYISACDYGSNEAQRHFEHLFSVWEQCLHTYVSRMTTADRFAPFFPFLGRMNEEGHFGIPEQFYTQPARRLFDELTATAFGVLKRFYEAKADKTLHACFEAWVCKEGYSLLFSEYPFLFRLLSDGFYRILRNLKTIQERLAADRQDIAAAFGIEQNAACTMIETGLSDCHNDGQTVAILHFSDNRKLVYKPRSPELDVFWSQLLSGIFRQDKESQPKSAEEHDDPISEPTGLLLKGVKALSKGKYGYAEYIAYTPMMDEDTLHLYYTRCGALLAVISMMGGSDFHYENLIVSNGMPVLVDVETLITPWSKACYATNGISERWNPPALAVGRSILLSKWVGQTADGAVNIGALCSFGTNGKNVPRHLDGTEAHASDYSEQIIGGYQAMNRLLAEKRGYILCKLNELADVPIRFVLRNTRVYVELLKYFTNLRGLTDGNAYGCVTARVYSAFLLSCSEKSLMELLPLIKEEHRAIARRDVPVFYSRGGTNHLYRADGKVLVPHFFEISPIDVVARNLAAITPAYTNQVSRYIEISLKIESLQNGRDIIKNWSYLDGKRRTIPRSPNTHCETDSDNASEAAAVRFAEGFAIRAFQAVMRNQMDEKAFAFYAPKRSMQTGRYELEVLDHSLYNGRYGIACFLDLYGDYFGMPEKTARVEQLLEEQLNELSNRPNGFGLMDLSLTEGLAGFFLMARNHFLIKRRPVPGAVCDLIAVLSPEDIRSYQNSDYFNGLSGLLYAICELNRLSDLVQKRKAAPIIRMISEEILRKRGAQGWFCEDTEYYPLTGLAHGQIGYALALTAALPYLEGSLFEEAVSCIQSAVAYEEHCLDREFSNLPDYRKFQVKLRDASPSRYTKRFMHGNCSGIIGTTTAVLRMNALLDGRSYQNRLSPNVAKWTEVVKQYLSAEELVGNDSLCCGTAAWLDLLCELEKLDPYHAWAKERIASITGALQKDGIVLNGLQQILDDISLFKGMTGLGYVCLRLLRSYPQITV